MTDSSCCHRKHRQLGPDGAFITGSDVLMDGGVTASYFYGELSLPQPPP